MTDTQPETTQFMTLGEIAALLGTTTHRVKYAVEQSRIKPAMRVGIIRVWSAEGFHQIKDALARIAANRRGAFS